MTTDTKQMGLIACISYVTGNIIGSGIFITPSSVLEAAGSISMALFIWGLCGVISLLGALAYIELGTAIPTNGGDFAYTSRVGWQGIAFVFMIVSAIITYPASTAIQVVTFGDYMAQGIVQFMHLDEGAYTSVKYGLGVSLLGTLTIFNPYTVVFVLCTLINMHSQNTLGSLFQVIVTAAKGLILALVIVIGAIYCINGNATENLKNPMNGTRTNPGGVVMSIYGALWSYAGWDILNYGAPSVANPRIALPVSLVGGLFIVTIVYVATNFSFAAVLGRNQMIASKAVAATFAEKTMGPFAVVIPFAAAILLLGSVNANIFCSSRIMLEAARKGHLFQSLSAVHRESGTPRAAVLFQFFIAIVFCFIDVQTVISYVSFILYGQKLVTMAALFYIRYYRLEVDAGVMRVPLIFAVLFTLICSVLIAIPFYTEPIMTMTAVLAVSSSFILYYFFVKKEHRPNAYIAVSGKGVELLEYSSGVVNSMLLKYFKSEIPEKAEPMEALEMVMENMESQSNSNE